MPSLVDYIRNHVDASLYYKDEFSDLVWTSASEGRVNCCFHNDKNTPSLSLNSENGKWYCHGCGLGGKSIVSFHAKRYGSSPSDAAKNLFSKYVHPVIPDKQIRRWKRRLYDTPTALRYMKRERHIKRSVLRERNIGWDGAHIVIPIYNEFELCINAKFFDPLVSKRIKKGKYAIKMSNYQREGEERSYGSPPVLYPIDRVLTSSKDDWVFVCEGEFDALVLIGLGLHAVTSTAGSKSWAPQYNSKFYNRKVALCYDNDEEGKKAIYKRLVPNLTKSASKIKRVDIPKIVGKDVSDWFREDESMRNKDAWLKIAKKSKTLVDNPIEAIQSSEATQVTLDQATQAKWFNQKIRVDALVTGKDLSPYILPKAFRVSCNKSCDECPLTEQDGPKECRIDPSDPKVLKLIDTPDAGIQRIMFSIAGMHPKPTCDAKTDVIETFNVDRLLLTPTISEKVGAQYVLTPAYYTGHGLRSNRAYAFTGITTVDPQDQHATHLFTEAKPVQDEIETFELSKETRKSLQRFQSKDPMQKLLEIAEWQARNVTKIKERPDLHTAIDLCFHSVRAFDFNGEYVRRGMLDILIVGDTRCGKGFVAEGLSRYYGLGEVASAENCSYAGLIGGIEQPTGRRNMVKWGVIPLNNERAVIMDEMSALAYEEISRMSRVRSEGIAEVHKIQREVTQANTRLIWLSNTRDGQPIMEQGMGVKAIKFLIGANEDISRFDFAMTVATNEVPSEVINDERQVNITDSEAYPSDLCRALVLWTWSRRAIVFTNKATKQIIRQSVNFGREYSPKIPLVQSENIRIKLAKISAAVAGRLFSTDETYDKLIVKSQHVDCACAFLRMIYGKPSMSYDAFSRTAIASSNIGSVGQLFGRLGADRQAIIVGLLDTQKITVDNLADYYGDPSVTKMFIGDLVKQRCLSRIEGGQWYLKNPAFTAWLRQQRKEPHVGGNGQANRD